MLNKLLKNRTVLQSVTFTLSESFLFVKTLIKFSLIKCNEKFTIEIQYIEKSGQLEDSQGL
jgi:hypothetical protein